MSPVCWKTLSPHGSSFKFEQIGKQMNKPQIKPNKNKNTIRMESINTIKPHKSIVILYSCKGSTNLREVTIGSKSMLWSNLLSFFPPVAPFFLPVFHCSICFLFSLPPSTCPLSLSSSLCISFSLFSGYPFEFP